MRAGRVSGAIGDAIARLGPREFTSAEIARALPAFKGQTIRSHLNWLASRGQLARFHVAGERALYYCVQTHESSDKFFCSAALVDTMKHFGPQRPQAVRERSKEDYERWVGGILGRVRSVINS